MLPRLRNLSLATWMLIAIVAGIALGSLAPDVARQTAILSTICTWLPLSFARQGRRRWPKAAARL